MLVRYVDTCAGGTLAGAGARQAGQAGRPGTQLSAAGHTQLTATGAGWAGVGGRGRGQLATLSSQPQVQGGLG